MILSVSAGWSAGKEEVPTAEVDQFGSNLTQCCTTRDREDGGKLAKGQLHPKTHPR